jgi:hypothetical protein
MESAVNFLPGKRHSFLPVGRLDPAPADGGGREQLRRAKESRGMEGEGEVYVED